MHMYYIAHSNSDSESLDLFVTARNAEEAVKFWRDHFELEHDELPDGCLRLPDTFGQVLGPVHWINVKPCLALTLTD